MAIKLTYIFLKTINITKNIELFASDSFYFCNNSPIKAVKNSFYVKEDGEIKLKILDKNRDSEEVEFYIPKTLDEKSFTKEIEPLYILPPI